MGWEDVDLSGVNPNYEIIAQGDYVFQVCPGAGKDDYGNLSIQLNVQSDGPFKGRRVFVNLPDPGKEENKWVLKALKRVEQAVGIEQEFANGETVIAWAKRLGENFATFGAPLGHRQYTNKAGDLVTTEKVNLSKARPAVA